MSEFWKDVISEALNDAAVSVTESQLEIIVKAVEEAHDGFMRDT